MSRDTYSGGGSIIRIGKDGLKWTSVDPAESKTEPSKKSAKPNDTETEKQIRSFVSQCAAAYAAGKLDASFPIPPTFLKRLIKSAGGNIAWLEAERRHQAFFHKAYCRIIGKDIPIEKVWARPGMASRNGEK